MEKAISKDENQIETIYLKTNTLDNSTEYHIYKKHNKKNKENYETKHLQTCHK